MSNTKKLLESIQNNFNESTLTIDRLINDMNSVDWNNVKIPDYLEDLIDRFSHAINTGTFNTDDERIEWEINELSELGFDKSELEADEDRLFDIDDYLTNLAL